LTGFVPEIPTNEASFASFRVDPELFPCRGRNLIAVLTVEGHSGATDFTNQDVAGFVVRVFTQIPSEQAERTLVLRSGPHVVEQ
jgi:hypothetical protein